MNDKHYHDMSNSGKSPRVDFAKFDKMKVRNFTDRSAPVLPGLHCFLALPKSNHGLQVASYRRKLGSIEGWIATISSKSEFSSYLIRHEQIDCWTSFDSRGFVVGSYDQITTQHVQEWSEEIEVSREDFTTQAREALGIDRLHLLACSEFHPGASAADHANLTVMLHRMIVEASNHDLQHIFLVDSKKWPCRVTGLFATIEELSPGHQDRYLDRYKWLENSWPLMNEHYLETLARRLAESRGHDMEEVIAECGKASGKSGEIMGMRHMWALASRNAKQKFARHVVDCLKDGLVFKQRKPEIFDPRWMKQHGAEVVRDFHKKLR